MIAFYADLEQLKKTTALVADQLTTASLGRCRTCGAGAEETCGCRFEELEVKMSIVVNADKPPKIADRLGFRTSKHSGGWHPKKIR